MRYNKIVEELSSGRSVTLVAHGNSMTPRIKSGDRVTLEPLKRQPRKGDAVLAKVHGHYYVHLVTAVRPDGSCQISNAHGHVNGWTRAIFGVVSSH